jgi:hypothetical protein
MTIFGHILGQWKLLRPAAIGLQIADLRGGVSRSSGLSGGNFGMEVLDKGMPGTTAPVCRLYGHLWSYFQIVEVAVVDSDWLAGDG